MSEISVVALNRVFPEGQKNIAAVICYPNEVAAADVCRDSYTVDGREVIDVYPSTELITGKPSENGRFVIAELSTESEKAVLFGHDKPGPGGRPVHKEAKLSVRQVKTVGSFSAWNAPIESERDVDPLADQFKQAVFTSPVTGYALRYNLFVPEGCDEGKEFPLVLYIHDRGPLSTEVKTTLYQGIGAVVWTNPEDQKKHPCFVLAPQFDRVPFRDMGEDNPDNLETVVELINAIAEQYPVDRSRIYATGQSMGGMGELELNIRYPHLFAASLLVACQWDTDAMAAIAGNNLFFIISRGDPRAYPTLLEAFPKMEKYGAVIVRDDWDQDDGIVPPEQAERLCRADCNIRFAVLKTEKRDFSCHSATWRVAYGIPVVRDWLFEQHL